MKIHYRTFWTNLEEEVNPKMKVSLSLKNYNTVEAKQEQKLESFYPEALDMDQSESNSFNKEFEIIDPEVPDANQAEDFNRHHPAERDQGNDMLNQYDMMKYPPQAIKEYNDDYYPDPECIQEEINRNHYEANYDPRRTEMHIKQEIPSQPAMIKSERQYPPSQDQFKVKDEEIEREASVDSKDEVNIIMNNDLLHLYNYVAKYNGQIYCFICETLIDHDQIKIFCAECSEAGFIKAPRTDQTNEILRDPNTLPPLYTTPEEDQISGVKLKYSLDKNKRVKRYKASKNDK